MSFRPLVADACPAHERDPAIDDEQLPVGAIVEPRQFGPGEPLVQLNADPGLPHLLKPGEPEPHAANRVDHQGDLDAGAGPFHHGVHEPFANAVRVEDVAFHRDRGLRVRDGVEHGRIELDSVGQHLESAVMMDRCVRGTVEDVQKFFRAAVEALVDFVVDAGCEEHLRNDPRKKSPPTIVRYQ